MCWKHSLNIFRTINLAVLKDDIDFTAQKMKFSIKHFFSKCYQIRSFLRIWLHLLKKSLMENITFCAVLPLRTLPMFLLLKLKIWFTGKFWYSCGIKSMIAVSVCYLYEIKDVWPKVLSRLTFYFSLNTLCHQTYFLVLMFFKR